MIPSFNTKVQLLSQEGCSFSSKAEKWLCLVRDFFFFLNEVISIFASLRARAAGDGREQEVLEINWLYENEGSKTSFICSNHNPLDLHFVLCLSNQTFPEENLILLGPVWALRVQATWPPSISPHYRQLQWFRSQIPRVPKMDHSVF